MPRYFFNVHDSVGQPDPDGTLLPDDEAARAEAIDLAGHMIRDYARDVLSGEAWRIQVTDDQGRLVFSMDVRVTFGRDQMQ